VVSTVSVFILVKGRLKDVEIRLKKEGLSESFS
jgi:hypothetical protein